LTVILDTTFVVGLMGARDDHHAAALSWFATVDEDLVTSPLAVAEMDHLVSGQGGSSARDALWANLETGAFTVRWWADAVDETLRIARRHPFLGLTDASLVAVASRVSTTRIATFDQHFRSVAVAGRDPFVLLPADA
jgi:predicted nucleic acid-binding protein